MNKKVQCASTAPFPVSRRRKKEKKKIMGGGGANVPKPSSTPIVFSKELLNSSWFTWSAACFLLSALALYSYNALNDDKDNSIWAYKRIEWKSIDAIFQDYTNTNQEGILTQKRKRHGWLAKLAVKRRVFPVLSEVIIGGQTLLSCIVPAFKGELRNRFNIISEERVKFSEQNSETWWKLVEK